MSTLPSNPANVGGILRISDLKSTELTPQQYEGQARLGEIVIDISTPAARALPRMWVGNISGDLLEVGVGGQPAAGNAGEIQYNDANAFAASPDFVWDAANSNLIITGNIIATGKVNDINFSPDGSFTGNNITANGNLTANGNAYFNDDIYSNGTLYVNGNTIHNGNIVYRGSTVFEGNVQTLADVVNSGNVFNNGNVVNNSNSTLNGTTVINGNLSTNGTNYLNGNTISAGNLTTTGSLTANGETYFNGNTYSNGLMYFNGDTVSNGNVFNNGVVYSNANTVSNGTSFFNGDIVSNANLITNGEVTNNGIVYNNSDVYNNANVYVGGNTVSNGSYIIDGSIGANGNITSNSNMAAAGNLTVGGNILGDGDLTIAGTTTTGNLVVDGNTDLGDIANVTIGGGTNGQLLTTYGNGSLYWSNGPDQSTIANGTSNVQVNTDGNVDISIAGIADVTVFSTGGVNTAGWLSAAGNVIGANIVTTGRVVATGNITTNANVITDSVISRTGDITLTGIGGDGDIILTPSGSGVVDVSTALISNVADPVGPQDAATKSYVDAVAQGLTVLDPAVAATTVNLAGVYNNGASGVGATITLSTPLIILDDVGLTVGDRVLVKNQTDSAENGVYQYISTSVLTRTTDLDIAAEIQSGAFVFVEGGSTNAGSGWVQTQNVATVGTDPVVFQQFSAAGNYTAGVGLQLIGSEFSIASTGVVAGSYGNASWVPSFAVNSVGGLTAAGQSQVIAFADSLYGPTLDSNVIYSSLTTVGTLQSLNVSGNIVGSSNLQVVNADVVNLVNAAYFQGDGSLLTNLPAGTSIVNGTSNVVVAADSDVTVSVAGTGDVVRITNTGVTVIGNIAATANVSAENLTLDGNAVVGANVTVNGGVFSNSVTSRTGDLYLTAIGVDGDIYLQPAGNGIIDAANSIISNIRLPISSSDVTNKQYVDAVATGLDVHQPVRVATTATLESITGGTVTYNNGIGGSGATLTLSVPLTTLDGVTLANGDRVLVKNQSNAAQNGVYVRTSSTVLTRATDFDTVGEFQGGEYVFITDGTIWGDASMVQNSIVATMGVSDITWVQFSVASQYSAGVGLSLVGTQFSLSNTGVVAGSYGSADSQPSITVDAQGRISSAGVAPVIANAANLIGDTLSSNVVYSNLVTVGDLQDLTVIGAVVVAGDADMGNVVTANYFEGNVLGPLANGTTSISIPTASGNVFVTVNGVANVLQISQNAATLVGNMVATGNSTVGGNLIVNGSNTFLNTDIVATEARMIRIGGGVNGVAPTSDDNRDRGTLFQYFTTGARTGFMGWDDSASEFAMGSNVGVAGDVVTFNQYGNLRASTFLGNGVLGNLTVTNRSNLGDVGNITIVGGNVGDVLLTDGTGNVFWGIPTANIPYQIANGTSNVSLPTVDGNVEIAINGNANLWNFGYAWISHPDLMTVTSNALRLGVGTGSAGPTDTYGANSVHIGTDAGSLSTTNTRGIAIGLSAGKATQGVDAISIGSNAGATTQGSNSIAIGSSAGNSTQGSSAIAIGRSAGATTQGTNAIAIGSNAASSSQSSGAIAIGNTAGQTSQGDSAVAIGRGAGTTTQRSNAIAIGQSAGGTNQGNAAIAIGRGAGLTSMGDFSIAIGANAGNSAQANNTIVLNATGANLTAATANGFYVKPVRNDVATVGNLVFYNDTTGEITFAAANVAISPERIKNGTSNVAIDVADGPVTVGINGVANVLVLTDTELTAGNLITVQLGGSYIAAGNGAGVVQSAGAVRIGDNAGATSVSAAYGVHLGSYAGYELASANTIAIGSSAGRSGQGANAIAIGRDAGYNAQGGNSIVIGASSGNNIGGTSVAIGTAAVSNAAANNTLTLNATGTSIAASVANAFYVKPVRNVTGEIGNITFYNPTTGEVSYAAASLLLATVTSIANGNSNVVVVANGNVNTSSGGNANVFVVTPNGANVNGTLTVSGETTIDDNLTVNGNTLITGNLTVSGNTNFVNVSDLQVEDPIIELGGGPNGAPLVVNDGKDRGSLLHYYTTQPVDAFMGWDTSAGEFALGSNVTVANNVVTFNQLGNLRLDTVIGNGSFGTITANSTVTLGAVGNVSITGGTVGQSLTTYGNGTLYWSNGIAPTSIINGNSNVVVTANSDIVVSVAGVAATATFQSDRLTVNNLTVDSNTLALGQYSAAGTNSISIGTSAGNSGQADESIAIGYEAGQSSQAIQAIAIGRLAGGINQATQAVAIGVQAGVTAQGSQSVAIGPFAGNTTQGSLSVAVGNEAGKTTQGTRSVAVGSQAAETNQSTDAVAVGANAGQTNQRSNAVAVGGNAGLSSQGNHSVAVGFSAGTSGQANYAIAIGSRAGNASQGLYSIAIGANAGNNTQANNSIILNATGANLTTSTANSLYIAPVRTDSTNNVNVMFYNSTTKEVTYTTLENVSVATNRITNGTSNVIISTADGPILGYAGGNFAMRVDSTASGYRVALGVNAGEITQGDQSIAVGQSAGYSNQGSYSTALGAGAGAYDQGNSAVAVGVGAGGSAQGIDAIAIGNGAGPSSQSPRSIVIGAGADSVYANSVAIGYGATATGADQFHITPVRYNPTMQLETNFTGMFYDTTTGEVGSGPVLYAGSGNTRVGVTGLNGTGYVRAASNATVMTWSNTGVAFSALANLGNIANVRISGGSSGQLIQTDGAGNLSFTSPSGISVANANYANFAGSVVTASQPNITSVGTLTGLTVGGVSNLSAVGNVIITGGINGQVLSTNGSGNLSWVTVGNVSNISNGSSNVNISTSGGDITMSVAGAANVVRLTSTQLLAPNLITINGTFTSVGTNAAVGTSVTGFSTKIGGGAGKLSNIGVGAVMVGWESGYQGANGNVTLIGNAAGRTNAGDRAIAIGASSGEEGMRANSITIGAATGSNIGVNSVAIGTNGVANGAANNTITLNATGSNITASTANAFYVAPIRQDTANVSTSLYYNTTTKEVTYSAPTPPNSLANLLYATESVFQSGTSTSITRPYSTGASIVYSSGAGANISLNWTGVNSVQAVNTITTLAIMINQGSTPRSVSSLSFDSVAQTVKWVDGIVPAGQSNCIQVFTYTALKTAASTWTVIGQVTRYA